MAETLTFRKYRGAFGVEYQHTGRIKSCWRANLREVKRWAREQGAEEIELIDSCGHVQRPQRIIIRL